MKKLMSKPAALLLAAMLVLTSMSLSASASDYPTITLQPQNLIYPEGAVAIYSVEATGSDLVYRWFINFGGTIYEATDASTVMTQPWTAYAGAGWGTSPDGSSFFFEGILPGLDGAEIYCEVSNSTGFATSRPAIIQVTSGAALPPQIRVPSDIVVFQGNDDKVLKIYCEATDPNGGECTYQWYSTSDGTLPHIMAMMDENYPILVAPTHELGDYFYVCMVETPSGGRGYSSVIKVAVVPDASAGSESEMSGDESTESSTESSSEPSSMLISTESGEESSKDKPESSETNSSSESSKDSKPEGSSQHSSESSNPESSENSKVIEPPTNQQGNQNILIIALLTVVIFLLIGLIILLIILMQQRKRRY